jgi:DNA-binding transcriptional MerR regulator
MKDTLTVQGVCDHFGVGRETLLRWEARGLLKPDSITESGHRRYDAKRIQRMVVVIGAKNAKTPVSKQKAKKLALVELRRTQ